MTTQDLVIRPARIQDLDTLTRFSAAMALETERRTLDPPRLRQGTLTVLEEPHHGCFLRRRTGEAIIWLWGNSSLHMNGAIGGTLSSGGFKVSMSIRDGDDEGSIALMHTAILAAAHARTDVCGIRLYVEQENAVAQSVYKGMNLQPTKYAMWEVDFVM